MTKSTQKKAITTSSKKSASEAVTVSRLPTAFMLAKSTYQLLRTEWKLFLGLTLMYAVLNLILVRGLSNVSDISAVKDNLQDQAGILGVSLGGFAYLLSSSNAGSGELAGMYQTILVLIVSLAVIWALRERLAGAQIRIRDAFYKGMYPLIPVILVLLVIGLQLIPFLVGATIYSIVIGNGIANSGIEYAVWAVLFLGLSLASIYMIASSIFAVYIATLPDMTPLKALRSARDLVRHRRWQIIRKLLFLPVVLLVMLAVITIPVILTVTTLAPVLFFVLSMFGIVVVHTYLYLFYRELLK